MSQFSKFTKPAKVDENLVYQQPIKYKKINPDARFGMNIAIIAPGTFGKTLTSVAFGFFNSKYVSKLDKEKFPYSIQLLKQGYMPEVERIVIHDIDNGYEKAMSRGSFKTILSPLIPILDFVEFDIPERDVEVEKGKTKSVRVYDLLKAKREVEDAAKEAVKDFGPEVLWVVDSLSEYYQVLDSMFSVVYEAVYDKEVGSRVENQRDWQIRNAWWTEYMKRKRKYKGWQVDTVKAIPIPKQWIKTKKVDRSADPFNIKWAEGSGGNAFNLDQVYRLYQDADGIPYFNLVDGRHKSKIAQENMEIYYEYDKRTVAFFMIEHIAKYIIEGSEIPEEELW